ncbi:proton-coupled thiamine transporter YuaJ [Clostridia bacterium]|nr:proton-coupled thiamine transporter YuaJ [Clostridia bacterium]
MASLKTRQLVESAILIALAFLLSFLKYPVVPNGGSVTLLSMLPILLIGVRNGAFWGFGAAVVYGALQMLQAFYAPPVQDFISYLGVVTLDYLLAFGLLGVAGLGVFRKNKWGLVAAAPVALGLRYVSHILSGVIIWGSYSVEIFGKDIGEFSIWPFSIIFNGTYMIPEIILTTVVAALLVKTAPQLLERK